MKTKASKKKNPKPKSVRWNDSFIGKEKFMKYTLTITINAKDKEEVADKLANKIEIANSEFQLPDSEWLHRAGFHFARRHAKEGK